MGKGGSLYSYSTYLGLLSNLNISFSILDAHPDSARKFLGLE